MKRLVLAAMLAMAATNAHAQDDAVKDAVRADLRCFLGMSVMAKNPTYKEWATFGMFFYSGRIEGRQPDLNLASALKREAAQMRAPEYQDEIKRCSDGLGEKSRGLEALKSAFQPRGVGR
jgi:hypothetical protein